MRRQIYASSSAFAAGTLRLGSDVSHTAGTLNGSASDTAVDEAFATSNTIDARFFGAGSLTLGDGGSLTALFSTEVASGSPPFLFVGDVGLNGESLFKQITISDSVPPVEPPAVPFAASALLLLGGLGGFWAMRHRRKA